MLDPAAFNNDFIDEVEHEFLYIHDPERIQEILNAKYCKANQEQNVQASKNRWIRRATCMLASFEKVSPKGRAARNLKKSLL